jgi:hypothetical protein
MTKKILSVIFLAATLWAAPAAKAQHGKSEITLGYGYLSAYQFANKTPFNTSSGTIALGYKYYLSNTVTLGMGIGYEHISNWASFTSFVPEVTFRYLDTKDSRIRVRLYGAVGYGFTILHDLEIGQGYADESGAKPWGFQLTPIGMRWGRKYAWFAELGTGYKGTFHGGVAIRFPRKKQYTNQSSNQ